MGIIKDFLPKYPNRTVDDKDKLINEKLDVWKVYANAREEIRKSGIVRTNRAPEADFSEWIVMILLNGLPEYNPTSKDIDITSNGMVIQVKSVSKSIGNKNGYKLQTKDKNNKRASHYAFVWFKDHLPKFVFLVDYNQIKTYKKTQIHISDLRVIGKEIYRF